jgi:nitrate/nitrite transport system ATP-binding protein
MAFIEIRDVCKTFRTDAQTRPVLERVALSIERGEFVSIVGMMGCGKSTLLKIAAGLVSPDAGAVVIDGVRVTGIRPSAAIVFQNYSLLPWFSALENVRLAVGAAFPDWTRADQLAQARRHLEAVGLGAALNRRPGQLSGGMRQRVAIARAFAIEPQILFLDEPFGALDALTREALQQELARLCSVVDRPVTTLMITNSVEEALLLSDRIVPMVPSGAPTDGTLPAGATLGSPVEVALPRPRSAGELLHDETAARVRGHVVASLTDSLHRSPRRATAASASSSSPETRVSVSGPRDLTYTPAVSEP